MASLFGGRNTVKNCAVPSSVLLLVVPRMCTKVPHFRSQNLAATFQKSHHLPHLPPYWHSLQPPVNNSSTLTNWWQFATCEISLITKYYHHNAWSHAQSRDLPPLNTPRIIMIQFQILITWLSISVLIFNVIQVSQVWASEHSTRSQHPLYYKSYYLLTLYPILGIQRVTGKKWPRVIT